MNPADASRILARLKAAFPVMTLDEEQAEILLEQVSLLASEDVLDEAVGYLIQREERFPPIAKIRLYYRSVADARATATRAIERAREDDVVIDRGVPEWVHVWYWQLTRTRPKRQELQTDQPPRVPVYERRPIKMRDFPQFAAPGPDVYTDEEYEKLRQGWIRAGSPHAGSVLDVVGAR